MLFKSINFAKVLLIIILLPINLFAETISYNGSAWYGFYFGGDIGGSRNVTDIHFTNANYFNTLDNEILGLDFNFDQSGVVGGGHIGYNFQHENIVYGLEGTILSTAIKQTISSPFFPELNVYGIRINQIGQINGHVGLTYYPCLLYVKGGWATIQLKTALNDEPNSVFSGVRERHFGWSIGSGVDYKVTPFISAGITFDYIKTKAKNRIIRCATCTGVEEFGTPRINANMDTFVLMARINYLMALI